MAVRALSENDKDEIKPVDFFLFDITGGVFEYQITEPLGPNSTHSKARCALAVEAEAVGFFRLAVLVSAFVSAVCPGLRAPTQEPQWGLWVPTCVAEQWRGCSSCSYSLQLSICKAGQ